MICRHSILIEDGYFIIVYTHYVVTTVMILSVNKKTCYSVTYLIIIYGRKYTIKKYFLNIVYYAILLYIYTYRTKNLISRYISNLYMTIEYTILALHNQVLWYEQTNFIKKKSKIITTI